MSAGSSTDILVVSNTQAKALAGSLLAIGEEIYRFKDYNRAYPGQPPWRSAPKARPIHCWGGTVRWLPTSNSSRGRRRSGSIERLG